MNPKKKAKRVVTPIYRLTKVPKGVKSEQSDCGIFKIADYRSSLDANCWN